MHYLLENKQLILRAFLADDLADVFAYTSQTAVAQGANFPVVTDKLSAQAFLRQLQQEGSYAVVLRKTQQVIGHLTIYPMDSRDETDKQCELGYALNQEFWGYGYGTQLIQLILARLKQQEYQSVFAVVASDNIASQQILVKNDFHAETVLHLPSVLQLENAYPIVYRKNLN